MLLSTSDVYLAVALLILVFSRRALARTIRGGVVPTSDEVRKSTMNILWSPPPYPAGMTQAPVTHIADTSNDVGGVAGSDMDACADRCTCTGMVFVVMRGCRGHGATVVVSKKEEDPPSLIAASKEADDKEYKEDPPSSITVAEGRTKSRVLFP